MVRTRAIRDFCADDACAVPEFRDQEIQKTSKNQKPASLDPREGPRVTGVGSAGSEEKVAFVGFPFRSAMSAEAHLLGIVSAEFVAEKLAVRRAPWLHFAIYDRQTFSAECTAGCQVRPGSVFTGGEAFTHLLFLTPDQEPHPLARLCYQTCSSLTVPKLTHVRRKPPGL
jgi:hypothetical protein